MKGMRMMVDLGSGHGPLRVVGSPVNVYCSKEARPRRLFRLLAHCVVPCWGFQPAHPNTPDNARISTVVGTFYGFQRGRVSFCIHDTCQDVRPILLLQFTVPTSYLAREMDQGLLRVTLECNKARGRTAPLLFRVKTWSMYFNGRRLGFAVRREMEEADMVVFKMMRSISTGAGVLPSQGSDKGELMYMRARFHRVAGSQDSETFHMINPHGGDSSSSGQELSIFLLRS